MVFFPKRIDFFQLFERQIAELDRANAVLQTLEHRTDANEAAREIAAIEHAADNVSHELIIALNRTFITPIDREDIMLLVNRLDDVVDMIDLAINQLALYRVSPASRELVGYYRLIDKAIGEIGKAIGALKAANRGGHQSILKHCEIIHFIENQADDHHQQTLGDLLNNAHDAIDVIKRKDIYESLETVADVCEDVAHVIETIVIKHQ